MARKITISIPDMLHERLEKWRRNFNLSKIFQEAVSDAIQKKEDFQKRIKADLDTNAVIERLKKEKLKSEGNYFDNGKIDGLDWVKSAHYEDITYALEWTPGSDLLKDNILGAYFDNIIRHNKRIEITDKGLNEYAESYFKGWKKGIEEFWETIKDNIE